jgi:3-mercaptopyruvate sulfurtransferase SseA
MGVTGDKPVICYCTTGRDGSLLWFLLRHHAGLADVRLYDGSMVEWKGRGKPLAAGE